MIEPFFFENKSLFACYHTSSDASSTRLLVICPPFFDEHRRCYRALAELAKGCAEKGVHVIRFDFKGTGESFGECEEVEGLDWIKDVDAAIEEGVAVSGADEVIVAGVRLGATLALQCNNPLINRFVLWDPVKKGRDYVNWLDTVCEYSKEIHHKLAKRFQLQIEDIDFSMQRISQSTKEELSSLDLRRSLRSVDCPTYIVSTDKEMKSIEPAELEIVGYQYNWPPHHPGEFVPKPVLQAITNAVISK